MVKKGKLTLFFLIIYLQYITQQFFFAFCFVKMLIQYILYVWNQRMLCDVKIKKRTANSQ